MSGETDLEKLVMTMSPVLVPGEHVYCTTNDLSQINLADIILLFREAEGTTVILERHTADKLALPYTFVGSWITLTVHSSLEAVGLTAVFAKALANANISCNVVAACFHDHIFVRTQDAPLAMAVLKRLSEQGLSSIS